MGERLRPQGWQRFQLLIELPAELSDAVDPVVPTLLQQLQPGPKVAAMLVGIEGVPLAQQSGKVGPQSRALPFAGME
jgi:hypothetical protein